MAEPVLMSPWIPVLSAFGGALITGVINIITNRQNNQSNEEKHRTSLIIQSAIENWKQAHDSAHKVKTPGIKKIVYPLDAYIIHMSKMTNILLDKKTKPQNIIEKIEETNEFMKPIYKALEELNEIENK